MWSLENLRLSIWKDSPKINIFASVDPWKNWDFCLGNPKNPTFCLRWSLNRICFKNQRYSLKLFIKEIIKKNMLFLASDGPRFWLYLRRSLKTKIIKESKRLTQMVLIIVTIWKSSNLFQIALGGWYWKRNAWKINLPLKKLGF